MSCVGVGMGVGVVVGVGGKEVGGVGIGGQAKEAIFSRITSNALLVTIMEEEKLVIY